MHVRGRFIVEEEAPDNWWYVEQYHRHTATVLNIGADQTSEPDLARRFDEWEEVGKLTQQLLMPVGLHAQALTKWLPS